MLLQVKRNFLTRSDMLMVTMVNVPTLKSDRSHLISFCIILSVVSLVAYTEGATYQDVINLELMLFQNYSKTVRPILNQSEAIRVNVTFHLLSILRLDDQNQELSVRAVLWTQWFDQLLTWAPERFGGLQALNPLSSQIWVPRINPLSPVDAGELGERWVSSHVLFHTGLVSFKSSGQLRVPCFLDMTAFPFDTQTCSLAFMLQDYTEREVELFNASSSVLMESYVPSGEWEVVRSAYHQQVKGQVPQTFSTVDVTLVLRRLSGFYMLNLLLPFLLISCLVPLTFLVPASSDERANFALSVLLSQVVFMDLLTSYMPTTSDEVPAIVVCCLLLLALSAAVVALSVMTISLHHHRARSFCLSLWKALSKLTCVKVCPAPTVPQGLETRPREKFQTGSPAKPTPTTTTYHSNGQLGLFAMTDTSKTPIQFFPEAEGERTADTDLKFAASGARQKEQKKTDQPEQVTVENNKVDVEDTVNEVYKKEVLHRLDKVCCGVVFFVFVSIVIVFALVIIALN